MKVGLIIYDSIDTITGGYIYDKRLVEFLRSKGVIVKIFSQKRTNFFGLIRHNFSKETINEIIKFSPDILLQDGLNSLSLFFLNKKLKKIASFPIISIAHFLAYKENRNPVFSYLVKVIEYFYFKSIDAFIFTSISTKQLVTNLIQRNQLSLIANPGKDRLDLNLTKEQVLAKNFSNELMIIFIGNVSYNKGLHILLQALAKIDTKLWRLSIVGDLSFNLKYTKKILKMITNSKLEKNINILGALDTTNMAQQLHLHHVLVVPSYYESYGTAYLEALGAGLPVIASKSGGSSEIVEDSITGFLIPPGDVTKVRNSINQLIENRDLLLKMSLSSLSAYQKLSSWGESMAKIYDFLHQNLTSKN